MAATLSIAALSEMLDTMPTSKKRLLVKKLKAQIKQEEYDRAIMESPAMQRALEDVRCGRVKQYNSIEELMDEVLRCEV